MVGTTGQYNPGHAADAGGAPATLDAVLERITYANQETGLHRGPGDHRSFQ